MVKQEAIQTEGKVKVKKSQLEKAVRALMQVNAKKTANANPLFGANAETMTLLFSLSQIPDKKRIKPMLIELPNPMYNDKSEVCFFAKDPQKKYKELLLQKHAVPGITKVIGMDKLKKNYKTTESRRALADAFDLFLCDARVMSMMPKLLGTVFYEKKLKIPVPVRLVEKDGQDPAPALKKAMNATCLRIPAGPSMGIKIGRCSMDEKSLVANAAAVISFVLKHMAENPVQTISVQATDCPALPIWRRASPGDPFDFKKWHSDASSSSASDTGVSGASDTESVSVRGSELPSDAGETWSTASDGETITGESLSELETGSELDSEAGDIDQTPAVKEELPLMKGLRGKKKLGASVKRAAPEADAVKEVEMKPPAKKAKKAKA